MANLTALLDNAKPTNPTAIRILSNTPGVAYTVPDGRMCTGTVYATHTGALAIGGAPVPSNLGGGSGTLLDESTYPEGTVFSNLRPNNEGTVIIVGIERDMV